MADSSFDIVSKVDHQEVDNALNQSAKETPAAPYTPRPRLLALPGGQAAGGGESDKEQGGEKRPRKGNGKERAEPKEREEKKERPEPEKGKGPAPGPGRKVPTPAEVWPPRRRPTPPPAEPRKPAPPAEQRRGA
jgi:hypothetical protein